jgi:hypothetical protein
VTTRLRHADGRGEDCSDKECTREIVEHDKEPPE